MKAMLEDEGGLSMHLSDVGWSADNFKRARSYSCILRYVEITSTAILKNEKNPRTRLRVMSWSLKHPLKAQ